MKLKPLLDRVVLKSTEAEETTKSGIILTGSAKEKPVVSEVVAVGPGGVVDGKEVTMYVEVGDKVVISNLFYHPKQGDIVVLRKQTLMEEPIVKRIIATEGQTVDIDFDDGVVYVDGKALDEPYVNEPVHDRENFEGKITVPEGCVFVMGDNRNASTGSRDARLGCVDERYIMGRVYFTLFPVKNLSLIHI